VPAFNHSFSTTRALGALALGLLGSGVVAVSFLALFAVLGFVFGYAGIILVLALSTCIWIGGTAYVARALYRQWSFPTDDPPNGSP